MGKRSVQSGQDLRLQAKKYVNAKDIYARESEDLYRAILIASVDGIAIMDLEGRVRTVSHRMSAIFDLEREEEAAGRTIFDFIIPEDHEKARANIGLMFQGIFTGPEEYRGLRTDGSSINIEVNVEFIRDSLGFPTGIVMIVRDIGERMKTDDNLRESEAHILAITSSSQDAIIMMESNGKICFWNNAATRIIGYTVDEAIGKDLHQLLTPQHYRERQNNGLANFQHTGTGSAIDTTQEVEVCHKDGHEIPAELSVSSIRLKDGWHAVGIIRDISYRKRAEAVLEASNRKLEALSITDALTGIANRRRFDEVLEQEYSRHSRTGNRLSLIFLDIDYFKLFNDTYGHVQGDECLRQIAQIITDCVPRSSDLVARYGGEEFACVLPETDIYGAVSIAEKIRLNILTRGIPHKKSSVADHVTVSLGVVTWQCSAGGSAVDVVAKADERLYRAKSLGRNRVDFFLANDENDVTPIAGEKAKKSPSKLIWKDTFCCGNPLIDSQHMSLFNKANELVSAIMSDAVNSDLILIIASLLAEVGQHFHDEQEIMEAEAFPGTAHHTKEHTKLLSDGTELFRKFKESILSADELCQIIVYDVILVHMLGADRVFFQFLCDATARDTSMPLSDVKRQGELC